VGKTFDYEAARARGLTAARAAAEAGRPLSEALRAYASLGTPIADHQRMLVRATALLQAQTKAMPWPELAWVLGFRSAGSQRLRQDVEKACPGKVAAPDLGHGAAVDGRLAAALKRCDPRTAWTAVFGSPPSQRQEDDLAAALEHEGLAAATNEAADLDGWTAGKILELARAGGDKEAVAKLRLDEDERLRLALGLQALSDLVSGTGPVRAAATVGKTAAPLPKRAPAPARDRGSRYAEDGAKAKEALLAYMRQNPLATQGQAAAALAGQLRGRSIGYLWAACGVAKLPGRSSHVRQRFNVDVLMANQGRRNKPGMARAVQEVRDYVVAHPGASMGETRQALGDELHGCKFSSAWQTAKVADIPGRAEAIQLRYSGHARNLLSRQGPQGGEVHKEEHVHGKPETNAGNDDADDPVLVG